MQQQQTISRLDGDMWQKVDSIQLWWPAQWLDWEVPKHFSKPNLHPRKGDGHCLVVCCQSDPLQLSESSQNHYIWEVFSANQWDAPKTAMPAASIGQKKGTNSLRQCPTAHCTNKTSEVEWISLQNFASLAIFMWPLATDYHFFKQLNNFMQGKCFHNQQDAENAFQEFTDSWSIDFFLFWSIAFYATGINKLISHWQKCVFCNGSYFD